MKAFAAVFGAAEKKPNGPKAVVLVVSLVRVSSPNRRENGGNF